MSASLRHLSAQRRARQTQYSNAVTPGTLKQDATRVRAYWTPERMKSAHSADELLAHAKLSRPPRYKRPPGVDAPALPKREVYADDFRGVWYYLRVWGTKA